MFEKDCKLFLDALRRFKSLDPLKDFLPVSQRDFMVLMIIYEANKRNEVVRPSDLAQLLELSLPATSDMLKKQLKKGWIKKGIDEADRRSYVVELSDEGISIYKEGKDILAHFLNTIVERYGRENMARLLSVMDDLYELMKEMKQEMLEGKNA